MTAAPTAPLDARRPIRAAAVLWDMDGTLVDTEPYWIECEYALVEQFGNGQWNEHHAHAIVGRDLRDSAAYIAEHGEVDMPIDDIVNELLDGVIARVQKRVPWRPGARELLAAIREEGVPCALVTMSWRRFAQAVVDALPAGSFAVTISGDEVANGKPHPEPYLAAADALGVHARDCVAIEDSPTGVRSAVAAGCRVFAVPNVVDIPPARQYTRRESLLDLDVGEVIGRRPTVAATRARRRGRILGGVALLALAGAVIGVALALPDEPPPPLPDIAIDAWTPYWALPDGNASLALHARYLREVSPLWYSATSADAITTPPNLPADLAATYVAEAKSRGIAVVPSITDAMAAGKMAAVLGDPATRTQHVNAIVQLVTQGGFAGIDLDYEKFAFSDARSTWPTTSKSWIAFLTELAGRLHAEGKTLTVSTPPVYDTDCWSDAGYTVYDYKAMGEVVDQIRIMAYDFDPSNAGPIAPIDWVQCAIRGAKKAVDDDSKLVLGVGLYGYNKVIATSGTCPADAQGDTPVTQRDLADLLAKRHATPVHDTATAESSFTYQLQVGSGAQSCLQTRQVNFVDALGARDRIDLARTERIGGVVLWALGYDSAETWNAIASLAKVPTTASVPSPTTGE